MSDSPPARELRLALAMRGGVSLAVWIGGAVAELDLARRAMAGEPLADADAARGTAYADLLRAAGYDRLKIDVLAGASAGGLNAVVFGYTQSVGSDLDWLRDVWLDKGDLWRLLHGAWRGHEPFRTESLLQGDAEFYRSILGALDERAGGGRATDHLTIDLSATLQTGPALESLTTREDIRPTRAHFRFRRTPGEAGGLFNDLPTADHRDPELIRRLAYAARTTSSFPGAFEPATVVSWVPEDDPRPRPRPDGDDLPENLAPVFSESWTDPDSAFAVMDGGVFDNIPIARAFQAIADAPASGPTDRVLIYLDPSPNRPKPAPDRPPRWSGRRDGRAIRLMRATLLRSAVAALRYKIDSESAGDDLRDLHALRMATDAAAVRRRQFVLGLPGTLATPGPTGGPDDPYRRLRAQLDGDRLVDLLTAPGVGFLRALVRQPTVTFALDQARAVRLREALLGALRARAVTLDPARDATALAATADLLVGWLRLVEETGRSQGDPVLVASAGVPKGRLYRVRSAAQLVQESAAVDAVTRALRPATAAEPTDPAELARFRLDPDRLAAAWWPDVAPVPVADNPFAAGDDAAFWDTLAGFAGRSPGELAGLAAAGWRELVDVVAEVDAPGGNPLLAHREGRPLDLPAAQQLGRAALLATGALPVTGVPRFDSITGDEPPRAPVDAVRRQGLAQALDRATRPGGRFEADRLVDAGSKLAGNQLFNFAGFLAAGWRRHDWQWGRADAAAGLLRIVGTGVGGDVPADRSAPYAVLAGEVSALAAPLDRTRPTLGGLPAERRFALATRVVHGALRALWPLTPGSVRPAGEPTVRNPVGVAALLVLRPLLVLLPLLLRPALLAGPLVAVLVADGLTGRREAAPAAAVVATALVVASVIFAITRLGRRQRRWAALTGLSPDAQALVAGVRRRSERTRGVLGLEGLLAVLGLTAALTLPGWERWVTVPVLVVVVLGLGAANLILTRITAVGLLAERAPPDRRARLIGAVTGAGVLLTLLVAVIAGRSPTLALAATGWAVGTLVLAVHDHWSGPVYPWVAAASSGVLAVGLLGLGDGLLAEVAVWGARQSWPDAVVPAAALAAGYAVARVTKERLAPPTAGGVPWRLSLGLVLLVLVAMTGALLVDAVWGWFALPTGFLLAGAACAATTLVTPYADIEDPDRLTGSSGPDA